MSAHKEKIHIFYNCFLEHKITEDMGKIDFQGMMKEIGQKNPL